MREPYKKYLSSKVDVFQTTKYNYSCLLKQLQSIFGSLVITLIMALCPCWTLLIGGALGSGWQCFSAFTMISWRLLSMIQNHSIGHSLKGS